MELVARDGPIQQVTIQKRIGKFKETDRTVREHLHRLARAGCFLKQTRKSRGRYGRTDYYSLSAKGIAELVTLLEGSDKDIELIRWIASSEMNRHLAPELFDLWKLFTEAGNESLAVRRLQSVCMTSPLLQSEYWAVRLFSSEDDGDWWASITRNIRLRKKAGDYLFRNGLAALQATDYIAKKYLHLADFQERLKQMLEDYRIFKILTRT